jgi:hypothetical protein
MQKEERTNHNASHRSSTTESKTTKDIFICVPHLWFEWTKNDRLSKVYEMQKMFHEKFVTVVEVQPIVETQIVTIDVNVVDVNVITRSKATEK